MGGSQPNLSELKDTHLDSQITHRKRKQRECEHNDIKNELADFRKEMVGVLREFAGKQNEAIDILKRDFREVKNDIENIKTSLLNAHTEQTQIKAELTSIKNNTSFLEDRMKSAESDIHTLKLGPQNTSTSQSSSHTYDEMFREFQSRSYREKNVIISGIAESKDVNTEERQKYDMEQVICILRTIIPDCAIPQKIFRLGKFDSNKTRPIKVSFDSTQMAKQILKNKVNNQNFQIFSDQTPLQRKFLIELRNELKTRQDNGESDLIIKYIRGTPKIIQSFSKNE